MKRMNFTSIFVTHEQLRTAAKNLRQDIDDCAFKPNEMPGAVMRLEALHQKILRLDVSMLKKRKHAASDDKARALRQW